MSQHTTEAIDRLRTEPTVSMDDAAAALGIGRSTVYAAARLGELPVIRVRNRLRVPSAWVLRQLHLGAGQEVTAE